MIPDKTRVWNKKKMKQAKESGRLNGVKMWKVEIKV